MKTTASTRTCLLFVTIFALCAATLAWAQSKILQSYAAPSLPLNGDGELYPNQYSGGGSATVSLNSIESISGNSVQFRVTGGEGMYAQFNPYNYAGNPLFPRGPNCSSGGGNCVPGGRAFARDYAPNPTGWQFNTYNRLRFWIKSPTNGGSLRTDGQENMHFGTYVKRVQNPDAYSDEEGGDHFYHLFNVAPTGTWTQVILNMHPSHRRGDSGGTEQGYLPYPTGETNRFNYFDALTRFYIQEWSSSKPATYLLDDFEVYRESNSENDQQIYSITGTFVPGSNRLVLTWDRHKDQNTVKHELRYAFSNIHQLGWSSAVPAPNGTITPPGWQGYNNMVYDTTAINVSGRSTIYIAIKPQNSSVFSQIAVPVSGGGPPDTTPPAPPTGLRIVP